MTIDISKLTTNWKTTANGICGLGIAVILAVTVLPPTAGKATVAVAALRAVVAFLQVDAK